MGVVDEVVAVAQMRGGKLLIKNRRQFDQQVRPIPETWMLEVIVRRLRATRSPNQNRAYWLLVVGTLSDYTGYSPEETHELLKQMFLPKQLAICDGNGEEVGQFVMGGSTRNLTTVQFMDYIKAIQTWARDTLKVTIPDPQSYAEEL